MKKLTPWQENITFLSVLYAMCEQKKIIPLVLEGDDVFLDPILTEMNKKGFIEPRNRVWKETAAGEALRGQMVAMYDQLLKFEIFANVNQTLQLTEDQSPDGLAVYDNLLDPRFTKSPESEDLRLAILDWYGTAASDQLKGKTIDLHQVVFMQKLRTGAYRGRDFWFNLRLGTIYKDIDAIVQSAVKWQDLGSDVDEASSVMNTLYSAGMAEQVKRDGSRCGCGAYLGMYEYYAAKEGKSLDSCPSCEGSFVAPQPTGEMCPNCNYDIMPRQRKCRGCGAKIDRSMAAGTISEVTTVTEEYDTYYNPWGGTYISYGYAPPLALYPGIWYDPFDPIASVATFGLICALL